MSNRLYIVRGEDPASRADLARSLTSVAYSPADFFAAMTAATAQHASSRFYRTAVFKCELSVKNAMESGAVKVAVYDEFYTHDDMLPYFLLARDHDYAPCVVHAEYAGTADPRRVLSLGNNPRMEPFKLGRVCALVYQYDRENRKSQAAESVPPGSP